MFYYIIFQLSNFTTILLKNAKTVGTITLSSYKSPTFWQNIRERLFLLQYVNHLKTINKNFCEIPYVLIIILNSTQSLAKKSNINVLSEV